jgi:hypothetical protein
VSYLTLAFAALSAPEALSLPTDDPDDGSTQIYHRPAHITDEMDGIK